MEIDSVDIDPAIVEVARKWFGYQEDQRQRAHVADGIKFVQDAIKQGSKFSCHQNFYWKFFIYPCQLRQGFFFKNSSCKLIYITSMPVNSILKVFKYCEKS